MGNGINLGKCGEYLGFNICTVKRIYKESSNIWWEIYKGESFLLGDYMNIDGSYFLSSYENAYNDAKKNIDSLIRTRSLIL